MLYNKLGENIHVESVRGNKDVDWSKKLSEPVVQVVKMELKIIKWSHSGRQVKILEFFTSVQEPYNEDNIISFNIIEERETSRGSLPVGNISSNEIRIRLSNEDRRFDTENKNSPLYELIKPNRRIRAWLGTEDEKVPMGLFWSIDWKIPEDDVYVEVIGRDRLDKLRDTEYKTSVVRINESVFNIAKEILEDAGLNPDEYSLDPELKEFKIPCLF